LGRPALGCFVDSNVLLAVGQPDRDFVYEVSLRFLEGFQGQLFIGPTVFSEVDFQLRQRHGSYQDIERVKHWLYRGCIGLRLDSQQYRLVTALAMCYRCAGWDGVGGDQGDRLHAATATVAEIPLLATWERRFIAQQSLITDINTQIGFPQRPGLRLIRPDNH